MWVLIIVAVLNGKVFLDVLPMSDKGMCERKAVEAVESAAGAGIDAVQVRCKELKIV